MYTNPQAGLYPNFTATPTSGASPLTVQFTDTTFTSDPGGVTSWAWDLDGNGTIDSNAQNPSFTYSSCGRYDVSLTVTDASNPTNTETKVGFIVVDPNQQPMADFTATPMGPTTFQFTDTSTGNPTSWAWDFDGDGTIDSAAQNPVFTYLTSGQYGVSLTATNACASDSITKMFFTNDECGGAVALIAGLNGPYTNSGATTSTPWPCALGGNDVWFSFLTQCPGTYLFETCGNASYDTALELFDGSAGCASLLPVQCNDDSCGLQSQITATLMTGVTYYLRVGGYNGSTGTFSVNVTRSGGTGTVATVFPGCGITLNTTGSPNIGTNLTHAISNVQGIPYLWLGQNPLGVPLCTACQLGTDFTVTFNLASASGQIPCFAGLVGATYYVQGADIGGPNTAGCPNGNPFPFSIVMTDTVRVTVGM